MAQSKMRAMLAITKGSLRSISRSPSAIVFSFVVPFIFILTFGFIGSGGGAPVYKVISAPGSDTLNPIYKAIAASGSVRFIQETDGAKMREMRTKGRIAGEISIQRSPDSSAPYTVYLKSATSANDKWPQLKSLLESVITGVSNRAYPARPAVARLDFDYKRDVAEIREYKTIDFILPGQLGFSLLTAGVFGVAFTLFNLRSNLVLKRFFATPVDRPLIILGESISRVIFQLMTAVVILLAGHFLFGYTLVHGFRTFADMMVLSFLGLTVFMGFGFTVSGLAKNESTIPPFANLITLPQFLLGGTFFSIEAFPNWLQPIAKVLPLTHLNTAMRSVAFEGMSLWDVRAEIGILLLWGIAIYIIASRVFKWE